MIAHRPPKGVPELEPSRALRVRCGVFCVARRVLVGVDYSLERAAGRASRALRVARPAILLGLLHSEKGDAFDRSVSVVVEVDQVEPL